VARARRIEGIATYGALQREEDQSTLRRLASQPLGQGVMTGDGATSGQRRAGAVDDDQGDQYHRPAQGAHVAAPARTHGLVKRVARWLGDERPRSHDRPRPDHGGCTDAGHHCQRQHWHDRRRPQYLRRCGRRDQPVECHGGQRQRPARRDRDAQPGEGPGQAPPESGERCQPGRLSAYLQHRPKGKEPVQHAHPHHTG